ncbi:MAG: hypothetical protein IJJ26_07470 [Victivallales bacterium]|nr:hypothetical protein [Victivallales bacterium]
MRSLRTSSLVLAGALLLAGCVNPGLKTQHVGGKTYTAELVIPEHTGALHRTRFVLAGWVERMHFRQRRQNVFCRGELFPYGRRSKRLVYGCAAEFLPSLILQEPAKRTGFERALKIGVGVIEQRCDYKPDCRKVNLFPWTIEHDGDRIIYRQECPPVEGYAYKLTVTVTTSPQSSSIDEQYLLENTGTRDITCSQLVHPFLPHSKKSYYLLPRLRDGVPDYTPTPVPQIPTPELDIFPKDIPEGANYVTAYPFGLQRPCLTIRGDRPLEKSHLWINQFPKVFAVEPFLRIDLKPGQSTNWTWNISTEAVDPSK